MAEELKVIGAGCGRTGTSSLREALKILGYNPYHMEECVRNDHFRLWLRAGRGDGAALDAALRGYDATTDFPAATFVDELVRRHPAAKVVLSTRDAGDWARSVRATIWHPHFLEKHWLFRLLLGKRAQDMCRMYRERFFGGAEPSLGDVDALKRAFEHTTLASVERCPPTDCSSTARRTAGRRSARSLASPYRMRPTRASTTLRAFEGTFTLGGLNPHVISGSIFWHAKGRVLRARHGSFGYSSLQNLVVAAVVPPHSQSWV